MKIYLLILFILLSLSTSFSQSREWKTINAFGHDNCYGLLNFEIQRRPTSSNAEQYEARIIFTTGQFDYDFEFSYKARKESSWNRITVPATGEKIVELYGTYSESESIYYDSERLRYLGLELEHLRGEERYAKCGEGTYEVSRRDEAKGRSKAQNDSNNVLHNDKDQASNNNTQNQQKNSTPPQNQQTQNSGYAIDNNPNSSWNNSSPPRSNSTKTSAPEPDYTTSYAGQKYIPKYTDNAPKGAARQSALQEQQQLRQQHQQRQQKTEALKQQLYAQNAEVMQMTAQYFSGDQLATGIAQTSYAVASSIASGNLDATSVATGAANLIGGLIANGKAKREERERQEAIAREEARIAAERKAYFDKLIVERKNAYSKLPAITYPNSATSQSLSTAYFFTTHFEPATLEEENPEITVSDVIAVNRYSDGSWPFLNSTLGKIPKVNTSSIALVGYFNTYDEAYAALSDLTKEFSKNGVTVEIISIAEVFDVPSDAIVSDLGNEAPSTDFWGNPVSSKKKKKAKTSKKPAKNASSDFWGETVKTNKTTVKPKKKITAKKKKSSSKEDDFWGESVPVKKKNN